MWDGFLWVLWQCSAAAWVVHSILMPPSGSGAFVDTAPGDIATWGLPAHFRAVWLQGALSGCLPPRGL